MTVILIVGAADTGRAPMAAALLRRLLEQQSLAWRVGSAGVLGHDDAPPEIEARDTMAHLGLDISNHQARSIGAELAGQAALLIALDSGAARVLRARFPEAAPRVYTLGELAGRARDIPDPFRMQIGAWMTYARELEALLRAGLGRMGELVGDRGQGDSRQSAIGDQLPSPSAVRPLPSAAPPPERLAAVERIEQLLRLAADMPGMLDWTAARARIETDLGPATAPTGDADLALAYGGVLRAALSLTANPPTTGQAAALREAVGMLSAPVGQNSLNELSARLAGWATL